jgi:2,3-bisphosphoglycerate-independent phosphoglycerate mutase
LIFDGLADEPIPALGDKTPLQVAKIPNLNKLASASACGTQNALPEGVYPTSEEAHMAIFGYDYIRDLPGRGVLEGLGLGIDLTPNDLVLRVDFGTVDADFKVLDPRAGNIKSVKSFARVIGEQKIGTFTFKIYAGLAHRGVLVVSGPDVSKAIHHHSTVVTDTDPHKAKAHRGGSKVLIPRGADGSKEATLTAAALWEYQQKVHEILEKYVENRVRERQGLMPANFILTRGAGFVKPVQSFQDRFGVKAVCVAGAPLYKGIARYLGMSVINVTGATGGVDTDVRAKIVATMKAFDDGANFVYLHFKGSDVVAEEEGDFEAKIKFFEKVDKELTPILNFDGVVCVTGDHATPCILKNHSLDAVPIMIKGVKKDNVTLFNEFSCCKGALGHIQGPKIMPELMKEARNV